MLVAPQQSAVSHYLPEYNSLATSVDIARKSIKANEGLRLKPYLDNFGTLTVGYGTNLEELIYPVILIKGKITKKQAEEMLTTGISIATGDAISFFSDINELSTERQAVIIEMAYNLGLKRLSKFVKLQKALEDRNFDEVYKEMLRSKWHNDFIILARGNIKITRSFKLAEIMRIGD